MTNTLFTDLQTQIENIHNTRDFERLVNDILSRIHGADYVATDHHGDGGMDGYISPSKTLIAKHCFEKLLPVKANRNSKIMEKTRSDLKKTN